MTTSTVYAWVTATVADAVQEGRLPSAPLTAPAIRVWGDVLLRLVSEKHELDLQPALEIRSGAVFAWSQPTPLPSSLSASGRVQLQLEVDPTACAIARRDLVDPLFQPSEWRALKLWLAEQGRAVDLVEEEVMVFEAPEWPMTISEGHAAVTSTDAGLLSDIIRYFEPDAMKYLKSWLPLINFGFDSQGSLEVVVPPAACHSVAVLA